MSSGWAYAAAAATVRAASPYPRDVSTDHGVRWEIATPAAQRITLDDVPGLLGDGWLGEDQAMTIPAFAQGVNLIAGTCGSMPLWTHKGRFARVPPPLCIERPDPDVPASVTWSRVYRDLVLRPYSWLLVTERLFDGFPYRMRHVPHDTIDVTPAGIYVDGVRADDRDVIRFDSPTSPGALHNGRRILTTAMLIEEATRRFARMDTPSGVLKQTGGPELLDEEIDHLLSGWEQARARRSTAFLNTALSYEVTAFDPTRLQLVEAREANAKDIARLLNLPPTFVNAETGGSLTYSTVEMQQQALQATTLWPYLAAVRDRLSMNDVTPRGTTVEVPSLGFMRTDLTGRASAYQTLIATGVLTVEEARALEQLPPLDLAPDADQNRLP